MSQVKFVGCFRYKKGCGVCVCVLQCLACSVCSERGEICGTVGRVDEFLKVMERLQAAIDFFKRNRIQSVESTATVSNWE